MTDGELFFTLMDELQNDFDETTGKRFFVSRSCFLRAYQEKRLYTLRMKENDSMFKKKAGKSPLFVKNITYLMGIIPIPSYTLPCLCVTSKKRKDTVEILWTASRARYYGFATSILTKLRIRYAINVIHESQQFWKNRDIIPIEALKMSNDFIVFHDAPDSPESIPPADFLTLFVSAPVV